MTCALCGSDNPQGAFHCIVCGTALGLACSECGANNHPKARRCGACGAPLVQQPAVRVASRAPRESRRIVTVLFADIVGFTSMVESYGDRAEEVRSLLKECFDALAAIVLEHGGTVEKFIGDAICALFGAPVVHEDDPERALTCALEMQAAIDRLNSGRLPQEGEAELRLRIGISTGEVVGGTADHAGEEQYSVTGDAVNTAARLETAATAGQVLVGEVTERMTRSLFDYEPAGEIKLKGKRIPVKAFILCGRRHEEGDNNALFVGRTEEIEHLNFCLGLAGSGSSQLVELVGDAGMGKSRLVTAFSMAVDSVALVCRGSCPPLASSPFHPFQSIAASLLARIDPGDGGSHLLPNTISTLQELVGNVFQVEETSLEDVASALLDAVGAVATPSGTAIIIENVQRADPESLDLLTRLAQAVHDARLLLLWTRRTGDELVVTTDTAAALTRLVLRPLNPHEVRSLLTHLLGGSKLPNSLEELIVTRSGGNPLYLEAMVRGLLDDPELMARAGSLDSVEVPATVQGLIQSRLDALPEREKLLLQEAAVVGREFDAGLLQRVDLFGIDVPVTVEALARRGLIERSLENQYRFRHLLTQEVAYDTMLQTLRSELHHQVAEALSDMFPDRVTELAPMLADHYAKAGETDRAVDILVQAGQPVA